MPKVIVAGGIIMDAVISVDRLPVPGEELAGHGLRLFPGGKGANQAVAAARAGADVAIVGCVGLDMCGERILAFMRAEQIDTRFVQQTANKPTDMTFIMISSDGRNTTIYDDEYYPSPSLESIAVTIEKGDVLISDFGIESSVIAAFFRHGRRMGAVNVFNAAPARPVVPDLVNLADIIVVNRFELSAYAGRVLIDFLDPAELRYAVESFATARQAVIVTFGARGAAVFSDGQVSWIDAISVLPIDTTGASDAFVGALGAALATSSTLAYAVRFANVAAGISVTRRGGAPSMPFRSETEAGLRASS